LGSIILVFMLVVLPLPALPCGSDCSLCHKIPKDYHHGALSTCKVCHKEHKPTPSQGCGKDCFECHDYYKVMELSPAHSVLRECRSCHLALGGLPLLGR